MLTRADCWHGKDFSLSGGGFRRVWERRNIVNIGNRFRKKEEQTKEALKKPGDISDGS